MDGSSEEARWRDEDVDTPKLERERNRFFVPGEYFHLASGLIRAEAQRYSDKTADHAAGKCGGEDWCFICRNRENRIKAGEEVRK